MNKRKIFTKLSYLEKYSILRELEYIYTYRFYSGHSDQCVE